jgi:predicted ATPase
LRCSSTFEEGIRLLTLTGPGGVGKTRVAIQAASRLAEHFEDGVFIVSLAVSLAPIAQAAIRHVCHRRGA